MGNSPAEAYSAPLAYRFAGYRLETDGTLLRGETPLHIPSDELAILRLLLVRAGEIVTPLELKRALWGETRAAGKSVLPDAAHARGNRDTAKAGAALESTGSDATDIIGDCQAVSTVHVGQARAILERIVSD